MVFELFGITGYNVMELWVHHIDERIVRNKIKVGQKLIVIYTKLIRRCYDNLFTLSFYFLCYFFFINFLSKRRWYKVKNFFAISIFSIKSIKDLEPCRFKLINQTRSSFSIQKWGLKRKVTSFHSYYYYLIWINLNSTSSKSNNFYLINMQRH